MKIFSPEPEAAKVPASLPARIGHEALCLAVVGIFGVFEFLVILAEFRSIKYFGRSRAADRTSSATKVGTGSRRDQIFGK
jgi:hypothetical protein